MNLLGTRMQINRLNLNVPIEGEGEPVLLVHGFPDSNYLWLGVFPYLLKAGYGSIAYKVGK
jgi:pimeloyl-ACP methyl ester carboxylesterase